MTELVDIDAYHEALEKWIGTTMGTYQLVCNYEQAKLDKALPVRNNLKFDEIKKRVDDKKPALVFSDVTLPLTICNPQDYSTIEIRDKINLPKTETVNELPPLPKKIPEDCQNFNTGWYINALIDWAQSVNKRIV